MLWGLACGGAEGVHDVLAGLTDELVQALQLAGAPTVTDLPHGLVAGR